MPLKKVSLLIQDGGYIKLVELDFKTQTILEKEKSTKPVNDIMDIMMFDSLILVLTKTNSDATLSEDYGSLLVFDQRLNHLKTKTFLKAEAFANWKDESIFLCANEKAWLLDKNFDTMEEYLLSEETYPSKIQSFLILDEINTGFILEQVHKRTFLHQISKYDGRFVVFDVDKVEYINGPANAQSIDLKNQKWVVFGTYLKSKFDVYLFSNLMLHYQLNEDWDASTKDRYEKLSLVRNLMKLQKISGKQASSTDSLTQDDIITNQNLPDTYEFQAMDVLAITPTTPCWGIVRNNQNYYLSKIDFGQNVIISFSKFYLLKDVESLSFNSKIVKIKNILIVCYTDEFASSDFHAFKVFCLNELGYVAEEAFNLKLNTSGKLSRPCFHLIEQKIAT